MAEVKIPLPPTAALPALKVVLEVLPADVAEAVIVLEDGKVHLKTVIQELIEYIAYLEEQRAK